MTHEMLHLSPITVVEYVYKGQTYEQSYRNGDCVGLPRAEKLCQEFASSGSESERDRDIGAHTYSHATWFFVMPTEHLSSVHICLIWLKTQYES